MVKIFHLSYQDTELLRLFIVHCAAAIVGTFLGFKALTYSLLPTIFLVLDAELYEDGSIPPHRMGERDGGRPMEYDSYYDRRSEADHGAPSSEYVCNIACAKMSLA